MKSYNLGQRSRFVSAKVSLVLGTSFSLVTEQKGEFLCLSLTNML